MKKVCGFLAGLGLTALAAGAYGADLVEPVVTAVVVPVPSLIEWGKANLTPILGIALMISELLGSIPALKGNGVLDTFVKFCKFMTAPQDKA